MTKALLLSSIALTAVACKKAPPNADPEFSDALVFTLTAFDDSEADLAYALRALEEQTYLGVDVEVSAVKERSLTPERLTEEDVDNLEHSDRPVADAVSVAVAGVSAFDPDPHAGLQLLVDHTPIEHYSPDKYTRTFLEGEDCWLDQECGLLRTENDVTKENALMTLDYIFYKDFRWIDMKLPDPSSVEPGEEPVNEGDPRWGFVARSWTTQSWEGRKGKAFVWQSFTLEIWIPRDGEGYIRSSSDKNFNDGDWTTDSNGGGTLRLLSLWAETEFVGLNVSDEVVAGTTMSGIDKNYEAVEKYLEENN